MLLRARLLGALSYVGEKPNRMCRGQYSRIPVAIINVKAMSLSLMRVKAAEPVDDAHDCGCTASYTMMRGAGKNLMNKCNVSAMTKYWAFQK